MFDSISHPNFHRIYPHKLFCDNRIKKRCVTHDSENVYYFDDDHLSVVGAKILNEIVISKVSEVSNNIINLK